MVNVCCACFNSPDLFKEFWKAPHETDWLTLFIKAIKESKLLKQRIWPFHFKCTVSWSINFWGLWLIQCHLVKSPLVKHLGWTSIAHIPSTNIAPTPSVIDNSTGNWHFDQRTFALCVSWMMFHQWKRINHKQITRWQHLSRLKASAFSSLQKNS